MTASQWLDGHQTGYREHRSGDSLGAKRHSDHYCDFSQGTVCVFIKGAPSFQDNFPCRKRESFSLHGK
jgi:hypothetical protein